MREPPSFARSLGGSEAIGRIGGFGGNLEGGVFGGVFNPADGSCVTFLDDFRDCATSHYRLDSGVCGAGALGREDLGGLACGLGGGGSGRVGGKGISGRVGDEGIDGSREGDESLAGGGGVGSGGEAGGIFAAGATSHLGRVDGFDFGGEGRRMGESVDCFGGAKRTPLTVQFRRVRVAVR